MNTHPVAEELCWHIAIKIAFLINSDGIFGHQTQPFYVSLAAAAFDECLKGH